MTPDPPEDDLTLADEEEDREETDGEELDQEALAQLVQELLVQISRTQLAAKLYANSNKTRLKAFDLLVEKLDTVLEHIDPLLLSFELDQVTWEGIAVYDPSEFDQSYATRLFREGVRQLAFAKGTSDTELEQFVNLLRPMINDDRDVVDLLWEAGFEHIAHVAVDGFTELGEEEEGDGETVRSRAVPRFHQVVEVLTGLQVSDRAIAVEPLALDFKSHLLAPLEQALKSTFPPDARAKWGQEFEVLSDSQLLQILDEYIVSLFGDRVVEFSLGEVVALTTGLIVQRLMSAEFDEARGVLARLAPHATNSPEHAAVIHEIGVRVGGIQTLDFVCEKGGPVEDEASATAAGRFFKKHASFSDSELLPRAENAHPGPCHHLIAGLVTERVRLRASQWTEVVPRLDGSLAIETLRSLADDALLPNGILEFFWANFDHSDPAAVATAIEHYPGPWEENFRNRLLQEIASPHLSVRCAVLKQIGASNDKSLGIYLLNRARKEGLMSIQADELELLLLGLVRLGGERYLPFLRKQLEDFGVVRGTFLINRDVKTLIRLKDEVRVVLRAVSEINSPVAVELLREARKSSRGRLKEYCDELWRGAVARFSEGARRETAEYASIIQEHEGTSGAFTSVPSQRHAIPRQDAEDPEWEEVKRIIEQPTTSPNVVAPEPPEPLGQSYDWRYASGGLFGRIGTEPSLNDSDPGSMIPLDTPEAPATESAFEPSPQSSEYEVFAIDTLDRGGNTPLSVERVSSEDRPAAPPSGVLKKPRTGKHRKPKKGGPE